ncbi:hypothetical protein [Flavobacterium sp.]|jgi:hypothetical protein|uniref:hypothetical protein n=1 Tax=Flavobacterium sp. TaxID=239 RepID=UPI0037C16144
MGMIGNTPYQGLITSGNVQDGSLTVADIADSTITPANVVAICNAAWTPEVIAAYKAQQAVSQIAK